MKAESYLLSATSILAAYDEVTPFSVYLKNHFRAHKKYGSRDRKIIAHLCFCFFRLGKLFESKPIEERLLLGQFLCADENNMILQAHQHLADKVHLSVSEKLQFLGADPVAAFPFADQLSTAIDRRQFCTSLLIQPDLFIRIRPGRKAAVIQKLRDAAIPFAEEGSSSIRLANGTKIEELLVLDEEAVVQDFSSQQVLNSFISHATKNETIRVWDCCAASGGKSILLYDHDPHARITVSDVRPSILHNLRNRFRRAGIQQYESFVADLSKGIIPGRRKPFDLVICDAPCSGSGTWARTPEQVTIFKKEKIEHYSTLQTAITLNASKALAAGGYFLYITCSVFEKENEEVVRTMLEQTSLKLITQQYHIGYDKKADTLFTALFQL